jgi:hypothetical protein
VEHSINAVEVRRRERALGTGCRIGKCVFPQALKDG